MSSHLQILRLHTSGGITTQDRVFLLSNKEASEYFKSNDQRCCTGTAYVKAQRDSTDLNEICRWWLRSPGYYQYNAAYVDTDGSLGRGYVDYDDGAIRPSLWISHDKYTEVLGEAAAAEHQRRLQIATQKLREELTSGDGVLVTFGAYEQDNDLENGPEPIEWIVLDVQDGRALLISKYGLDCQPYNTTRKTVTWETCSLRSWLNSDFMEAAFNQDEKHYISTTLVDNSRAQTNSKWRTSGGNGNNTQDQVFLLSYAEADSYLHSDEERVCMVTKYAKSEGAYSNGKGTKWWLRSRGNAPNTSSFVDKDGNISYINYVNHAGDAVRPALWISLESDLF